MRTAPFPGLMIRHGAWHDRRGYSETRSGWQVPKASFTYDPVRALDFSGTTGPYCMYTYTRTRSILRKADEPWLSIHAPDPTARSPALFFFGWQCILKLHYICTDVWHGYRIFFLGAWGHDLK